jgi:hypothetical protein
MKTFSQTALLAGTITFLMAVASSAFCQDGLQRIDAPPDNLQVVPELTDDAFVADDDGCQSCCDGCNGNCQGTCSRRALCLQPRALLGSANACACPGGSPGFLAGAAAGVSSMVHSGQPLIDPWARADWIAAQRAATQSWHAGYSHTAWGAPVALVVPPAARMQTRTGWGVSQTTVSPIYHQFERPYPGGMMAEGGAMPGTLPVRPTPRWPSHTDQFGVYYVRGPW